MAYEPSRKFLMTESTENELLIWKYFMHFPDHAVHTMLKDANALVYKLLAEVRGAELGANTFAGGNPEVHFKLSEHIRNSHAYSRLAYAALRCLRFSRSKDVFKVIIINSLQQLLWQIEEQLAAYENNLDDWIYPYLRNYYSPLWDASLYLTGGINLSQLDVDRFRAKLVGTKHPIFIQKSSVSSPLLAIKENELQYIKKQLWKFEHPDEICRDDSGIWSNPPKDLALQDIAINQDEIIIAKKLLAKCEREELGRYIASLTEGDAKGLFGSFETMLFASVYSKTGRVIPKFYNIFKSQGLDTYLESISLDSIGDTFKELYDGPLTNIDPDSIFLEMPFTSLENQYVNHPQTSRFVAVSLDRVSGRDFREGVIKALKISELPCSKQSLELLCVYHDNEPLMSSSRLKMDALRFFKIESTHNDTSQSAICDKNEYEKLRVFLKDSYAVSNKLLDHFISIAQLQDSAKMKIDNAETSEYPADNPVSEFHQEDNDVILDQKRLMQLLTQQLAQVKSMGSEIQRFIELQKISIKNNSIERDKTSTIITQIMETQRKHTESIERISAQVFSSKEILESIRQRLNRP